MATTITVVCPYCKNKMRASTDFMGKQGKCPRCKNLVEIQGSDESAISLQSHKPAERNRSRTLSSTDVNPWIAGLFGLATTIVIYLFLLPFKPDGETDGVYIGKLFFGNPSITFTTVFVTGWALAMLVMKFIAVKKQQSFAELELELIPLELGLQITPDNVDQFIDHLTQGPPEQRGSILGQRISGALEYFKSRNSVPEVQQYLTTHADLDASGVDAGYTLLRSFIWAVPILGFIGTVIGISNAVGGLNLGDADALKESMRHVTDNLGSAFDTTLLALIMAILILFPTEALRKIEYNMLDRIQAFANESLLRRLSDKHSFMDLEKMPDVVRSSLESAFQEHQRWLVQWQAQVSELGNVVGGEFESMVGQIQEKMAGDQARQMEQFQSSTKILAQIFDKMVGMASQMDKAETNFADRLDRLAGTAEKVGESLNQSVAQGQSWIDQQNQVWEQQRSTDFGTTLQALQGGLNRLVSQLESNDGNGGVELTQTYHARDENDESGGLFGRFRSKGK